MRWTSRFGRWLRSGPLGDWLAARLERALHFPTLDVEFPRAGPDLDGLRVALVSDLHAGGFVSGSDAARMLRGLVELAPDLILLVGDLIDSAPDDVLQLREALADLHAPLGVFAVPGNHDHAADPGLVGWRRELEALGVRVLINEGERLKRGSETLWLAGADDLSLGQPDLANAMQGCGPDEVALLMSHEPDLFAEAEFVGVELTLSGHTHGGQISLFGWAPWVRGHSAFGFFGGFYRRGAAQLCVGRGAGVSMLPLRIGVPPEIPILRIRSAQSNTRSAGPDRNTQNTSTPATAASPAARPHQTPGSPNSR
jgi:predicted MPP superfamily phosphohydrolase